MKAPSYRIQTLYSKTLQAEIFFNMTYLFIQQLIIIQPNLNNLKYCLMFFAEEILTSLDAVNGRKHPNAVQAKQLKGTLPLISIVLHLVTSPVSF